MAIDRSGLNKRLLDRLESLPNVKLFFDHKLTGADFNKRLAWFEQRNSKTTTNAGNRFAEIQVPFDFMIGADGAHSAVRYHMMKFARVNYQQEYIDTLWCEFHIPPLPQDQGGGFRLSPNHLHIWPGRQFMFIAIPSLVRASPCCGCLAFSDGSRIIPLRVLYSYRHHTFRSSPDLTPSFRRFLKQTSLALSQT